MALKVLQLLSFKSDELRIAYNNMANISQDVILK